MWQLLLKIRDVGLDILFPALCVCCETSLTGSEKESALCKKCESTISMHTCLMCAACGARMPENKKICHKNIPYRFGAAVSYENQVVKECIWQLKYQKRTVLARPLGHIMAQYIKIINLAPNEEWIMTPIPLHKKRERERGFNQANLIARHAAREANMTVIENILERIKYTTPQAERETFEDRRKSLENAFMVKNETAVQDKNIIVIDDVHTSGATMNAATRALKKAGAKKVLALVVARA